MWRVHRGCAEGSVERHMEGCAEGSVERHMEGCAEGSVERHMEGCVERSAERHICMEGCAMGAAERHMDRCVKGSQRVCGGYMEGMQRVHGEVTEGALRGMKGVWRVHGGCAEGSAERHTEGCVEDVWRVLLRGTWRGAQRMCGRHMEGTQRAMVDGLKTLKIHHCLSLVTICCPLATIDLVGDNREFKV